MSNSNIKQLLDMIDTVKETIPEGLYVEMCNKCKEVYEELKPVDEYQIEEMYENEEDSYEREPEVHSEPEIEIEPEIKTRTRFNNENISTLLSLPQRTTRLQSRQQRKNECIDRVSQYLTECENTRGKDKKVKIAYKLYDYLLENRWFVREHPRFCETVKNKLIELGEDPAFGNSRAQYYRTVLTDE